MVFELIASQLKAGMVFMLIAYLPVKADIIFMLIASQLIVMSFPLIASHPKATMVF
jgi:hypothetical protein